VKELGMARKIDDLGRIVLPVEMRRMFGIRTGDELEISVDGENIILRKIEVRCVFCGGDNDLANFRGKRICVDCRGALVTDGVGPAEGERARGDDSEATG
jgi:AbrB family transcriptional regulator, transcriptional pleiotropic regulator of transition state genes